MQKRIEMTSLEMVKALHYAALPLMDLLRKFHPHFKVVVDSEGAEMMEGFVSTGKRDYAESDEYIVIKNPLGEKEGE